MTELARVTEPAASLAPTTPFSEPWLSNLRRGMGWVSGKPALMSGFTITSDDRRRISKATLTFRRQITGGQADRQEIGVELAKLVSAFPAQDQSDSPAHMRIEAYFDALGAAPAWAVREARLQIIRGDTDLDRRFAPTPPQLADIVKTILRPFRDDLALLESLGEIEPNVEPRPEERVRVGEGMDELKTELRGQVDEEREKRHAVNLGRIERANDALFERECRKAGRDPRSAVSPSLLRVLGIPEATVKGDASKPVKLDADALKDVPDAPAPSTFGKARA